MNQRYRVLRPLLIHGRLAGCGEIVHLPSHAAEEWTASGHLRALDDADDVMPINGSGRWAELMQR